MRVVNIDVLIEEELNLLDEAPPSPTGCLPTSFAVRVPPQRATADGELEALINEELDLCEKRERKQRLESEDEVARRVRQRSRESEDGLSRDLNFATATADDLLAMVVEEGGASPPTSPLGALLLAQP